MTELRGTPSGANLVELDLDVLIAATDAAILELFAEWEEPITADMYDGNSVAIGRRGENVTAQMFISRTSSAR